ncbi:unnamed protein product [Rotaria magnacalcarata]|uniref:Uncharacterized protein n=2 Tax=Rotaria magnacalcarata TaxID=392030 RepID=A0A816LVY7_9BILA|nr:unnamed protein product [Rotaria magnacalcarata]CAF1684918.1 unnamed protein product [Rotaria magnacalcarata]CAF1944570.1 unnamed protein product [Rotaria magnacalcarata]CAF2091894.1 unnamed protein product [Rotaria magnacalcarata]CAF2097744.1 unnamed protein product [Rotaria magnacalcarata]
MVYDISGVEEGKKMNILLLCSNILILFPLFIHFPFAYSSTSCSIFLSLNCSCFQSNFDLNSTLLIKTYSHLYCQGNFLTEKTFQAPFGSDFNHQNHFRTISIEFFIENQIEIQSNQFDSLALLFSKTDHKYQINIFLRFNGFSHIIFHKYSLTSTIFQQRPQNKRLWLHFIPMRSNLTQIELEEENSTNIEDQFYFYPNCFSGLTVSQLTIYIHTLGDRFPSLYSFEQIFNNTNIGELHFHGSIIRPSSSSLKESFNGLVRSLTLHRHVDNIDANTFPFYSHVYSYTIHSIEAHSMNLSSFLPSHRNFRGLEIIKPRFQITIDQFIPTLDSLTIDVEDFNSKTLFAARHIYNLKLGSSLRTIDPETFHLLSKRLHHLDLSDINLSQMKSYSRCHLIKYLSNNYQRRLNIILPQVENLTECDCARLFIKHIQLSENIKKKYNFSTCSKLCYFSDCPTISEYFRAVYPLSIDENSLNDSDIETMNNRKFSNEFLPSIDVFSDSVDFQMMNFLVNQTSDQEKNLTQRQSTTPITTFIDGIVDNISVIENIQEYDDIITFSTPKFFEPWNKEIVQQEKELFYPNKNQSFSWLLLFIGIGLALLLVLIIVSLVTFFCRQHRRNHYFKHLPVYV